MNTDDADLFAVPAVAAALEALELALLDATEAIGSPLKALVIMAHTDKVTGWARHGCGCAACSGAFAGLFEFVTEPDEATCTGYFADEVLH
jgi:hypothetical protein